MTTAETLIARPQVARARSVLAIALIALLPLHTVFVQAAVAWKPYLVILVLVASIDVAEGIASRRWPWHPAASIALGVFLVLVLPSVVAAPFPARSTRLFLALGVGGMVMLVVERTVRREGASLVLRTVFWSAAAMAVTAVVVSILAVGALGESAVDSLNDVPGVFRVVKPAYLLSGFVAVTNWHQDPGYAAAWANLWAALALVASVAGFGSRRRWVDGAVLGGLALAVFMTMSRTGWAGFVLGIGFTVAVLAARRLAPLRDLAATLAIGLAVFVGLAALTVAVDRSGIGTDVSAALSFRLDQSITLEGGDAGELGETDGVVDSRSRVWPYYAQAFTDNPVRGIGLGTGWATEGVQEPHNLALQLLGETGLLGFVGFIVLLGTILWKGRGEVGLIALVVALLAAITQTVLFEPTWWFAAAVYLGGVALGPAPRNG